MNQKVDLVLDTCGLLCPEPLMLLHKEVRILLPGQVIEVLATDPSTQRDIPKFCHFLGHTLLENTESEGRYRYWIQKADSTHSH